MTQHKPCPDDAPPEVCALHLGFERDVTDTRNDVRWILRIGYIEIAALGVIALSLLGYFGSISATLGSMRSQIAVNTAAIQVCNESSHRSEDDRRDLHRAVEALQLREGVKMKEAR